MSEWRVEWKSDLNIYDPMQMLRKKFIIYGNISLWADIFYRIYRIWIQPPHFFVSSSQGLLQIWQVVSSTPSSSFDDSVKLLRCRGGPGCCSSWDISLLTNVPDGIFFPLPLSPSTFPALFCCNKFVSVSFIEIFALSWEIVVGSFLKISLRFNG